MQTQSKGQPLSRFETAIREAQKVVASMRDGDEIALVSAGGNVRVEVGLTDFPPVVSDRLAKLKTNDGPTQVVQAVEMARRLIANEDQRAIHVISDLGFDRANDLFVANDVKVIPIGSSRANVAITNFAARRSLVDPIGYWALVEVQNLSDEPTTDQVTLELDENLVDVFLVTLGPDQIWRQTITDASAQGGVLEATVDAGEDDALPLDNTARAIVPQRERIPIVLVSQNPSVYLQSVFESIPLVDLRLAESIPTQSPTGGFVVLHGMPTQAIPQGRVMVIDPVASGELWTLSEPIDQAIIAKQDTRSPLLPHIQMINASILNARGIEMDEHATPLLSDANGNVLLASRVLGDNRLVVFSANLDEGDLPLRIAFPVLMTNAVNWFLNRQSEIRPSLRTGETTIAKFGDTKKTLGPVNQVGTVEIESENFAVNLCNATESDLRQREELPRRDDSIKRAGMRSLWIYLTLKKFAAQLSPGQQGELSQAAAELCEALENKQTGQCKQCMSKLSRLCKKQGNCKKIGQCMASQLNRLSRCKSQCRGQCQGKNNRIAKSDVSSQKAGRGASGNPSDSAPTELQSSRRQEELTSQMGDGPSESEVIEAPEGEQDATRRYAAKYAKFRNQAEAVLDSEPLPLGHRQTVRDYFEKIRPENP